MYNGVQSWLATDNEFLDMYAQARDASELEKLEEVQQQITGKV